MVTETDMLWRTLFAKTFFNNLWSPPQIFSQLKLLGKSSPNIICSSAVLVRCPNQIKLTSKDMFWKSSPIVLQFIILPAVRNTSPSYHPPVRSPS